MLSTTELTSIARSRLKDAKALFHRKRYDGAVYVCGYAVEIALKARIAKTLKWLGFPETRAEFEGLSNLKTHDLEILLHLSGWEAKINSTYLAEWSVVRDWDPESRYSRPGAVTPALATAMIDSARKIVGAVL